MTTDELKKQLPPLDQGQMAMERTLLALQARQTA